MNVRIFVESTWKGPAKREGVAMWLVEAMKGDEPITRQGFIHLEKGTEIEANLKGLINCFHILKKPCETLVFTQCPTVFATLKNGWHLNWQQAGWINSKGQPAKYADLWEMLIEKMEPHTFTVEQGRHDYQSVMQIEIAKEMERWKRE